MNDLIKNILILGLLLIIIMIGGFVLNKSQIGHDYFEWLKSAFFSRINFLKAGISPNLPFEELGLDFSEIDIENLLPREELTEKIISPEIETEEGLAEVVEVQEVNPEPQLLTLEEIGERIDAIKEKADKIEQEINNLKTLTEIQEKINEIAKEVNILSREITEKITELT